MPRRRDERLRQSRRRLAVVLFGAACVAIATAWLARAAIDVSPQLDARLCPPEGRITGEVVVVLDATDPWSDVRRLAVRREMEAIRTSLPRFSRIHVHVVEPSEAIGTTNRLVVCNPGTLEQVEEAARRSGATQPLVSNADLVEVYRERFASIVDSVVIEEGSSPERASSPIMETVRQAVLSVPGSAPPTLFIVSDMHQNSSVFSAYVGDDWSPTTADSLADVYQQGTQRLADANVTILLLSAPGLSTDPDAVRVFWTRFFESQGARLQRIERIEG